MSLLTVALGRCRDLTVDARNAAGAGCRAIGVACARAAFISHQSHTLRLCNPMLAHRGAWNRYSAENAGGFLAS